MLMMKHHVLFHPPQDQCESDIKTDIPSCEAFSCISLLPLYISNQRRSSFCEAVSLLTEKERCHGSDSTESLDEDHTSILKRCEKIILLRVIQIALERNFLCF